MCDNKRGFLLILLVWSAKYNCIGSVIVLRNTWQELSCCTPWTEALHCKKCLETHGLESLFDVLCLRAKNTVPGSQNKIGVGARAKGHFGWLWNVQFSDKLPFSQIGNCCINTLLPLPSFTRLSAFMFTCIYFFQLSWCFTHDVWLSRLELLERGRRFLAVGLSFLTDLWCQPWN